MHRQQVTIEYTHLDHAVPLDFQEIVRRRLEKTRGQGTVILNVFLGQHGVACRHAPDDRYALVTRQADTARGTGDDLDSALACQGFEMFLRRIGGFEAEFTGNICAGRGIAGLIDVLAHNIQHLLLSLSELFHHGHHLAIYTGAVIIYSIPPTVQQG